MALDPRLAALRFGSSQARNTIELFLDYVCPFSKKQYETIYKDILPLIDSSYKEKVAIIFRLQVQPWHPASTLVHESALAVAILAPEKFWDYSSKLFAESDKFYDSHTVNEARSATYYRLSKLAGSVGVNESRFLDLLTIKGATDAHEKGSNGGNQITDLLKLQIKYGRQNGIHVSPTIIVNGLVDPSISSSFSKNDWTQYFDSKL